MSIYLPDGRLYARSSGYKSKAAGPHPGGTHSLVGDAGYWTDGSNYSSFLKIAHFFHWGGELDSVTIRHQRGYWNWLYET